MSEPSTSSPSVASELLRLIAAHRRAVRQERTFARLAVLTLGSLLALGRHTISQMVVALGEGERDWSSWYRLFNAPRVAVETLQATLVGEVLRSQPVERMMGVVLDATQVPRSGRQMPGSGWNRAPRTPFWHRSVHRAQRWEGLSWLAPPTATGSSRAVPLRFTLLRSARTLPCAPIPPQTEGAAAVALLAWLRTQLAVTGRGAQSLLVIGDGVYSSAPVLAGLPAATSLLARCAKNRALYALPGATPPRRGRPRRYGERGPRPDVQLHATTGWRQVRFWVRGREIAPRVRSSGPWLVKGAPERPLFLLVIKGVDRGRGSRRRERDPSYQLVTAVPDGQGGWRLPLPLPELLAWAWQRWEVEVMHRELKSGLGFGEQQAFSATGAQTVLPWVAWTYALLVLAGIRAWGLERAPGAPLGAWWRPRRWSLGRLEQAVRQELWHLADFQPVWTRHADNWGEMTAWIGSATNAALGVRRL